MLSAIPMGMGITKLITDVTSCQQDVHKVKGMVKDKRDPEIVKLQLMQMRHGLERAGCTITGSNQLVSDAIEFLTAEVSVSEKKAAESDSRLTSKEETVKTCDEDLKNARAACYESLRELDHARAKYNSAFDDYEFQRQPAPFYAMMNMTLVLYPFSKALQSREEEAKMAAEARKNRLEMASNMFDDRQKCMHEYKAALEKAEQQMLEESCDNFFSHSFRDRLQALQKCVFPIGAKMKRVDILVSKLTALARTAEFMNKWGTIIELDMVLNAILENLEIFRRTVPALDQ